MKSPTWAMEGPRKSNQISYMLKAGAWAVCKKSYRNRLEYALEDSIYQILFAPHGLFFHEIYRAVQMHHFLLKNQMGVQCLQLPAYLELEVLWTTKLAQEDPALTITKKKRIHTQKCETVIYDWIKSTVHLKYIAKVKPTSPDKLENQVYNISSRNAI